MNTNKPSLYERLGGEDMISALIPAFYVRVLADPELEDNLVRLIRGFLNEGAAQHQAAARGA